MTLKQQNEALNAIEALDKRLAHRKLVRQLRSSLAIEAYASAEAVRRRAARERMEKEHG